MIVQHKHFCTKLKPFHGLLRLATKRSSALKVKLNIFVYFYRVFP